MSHRSKSSRIDVFAASLASACLCVAIVLVAGSTVPATAGPQGQATIRTPLPVSQIQEEPIATARGDIVAIRISRPDAARRVAWVEKAGDTQTVWLDGKQVGGTYDEVRHLAFYGGSSVLTIVAVRNGKHLLRVGEVEHGADYTKVTAPEFGTEGEVAVGTCREKQCRLLVDGTATGPTFDDISAPDSSPGGSHTVYFGKRGGKWIAILDGKEFGPEMDDWFTHRWSSDGGRLAIAAIFDNQSTWVVDGRPGPLFDVIGEIAFSRDGSHFAFGGSESAGGFAKQDVTGSMVVDGRILETKYSGRGMLGAWTWMGGGRQSISKGLRRLSADFHGVSDPEFLASGELAFGRRLADGQVTVGVGDRTGPSFDDLTSSILVSAEGNHLFYIARKGDSFVEVRDQVAGATFPAKRDIATVAWIAALTRDRLMYSTVRGGAEFKAGRSQRALRRVVFDGVAEPEYDALGITPCVVSGDQHAYVVLGAEGKKDRLILNGRETPAYDDIISASISLQPPAGVQFVARQDRRLLRVTIVSR